MSLEDAAEALVLFGADETRKNRSGKAEGQFTGSFGVDPNGVDRNANNDSIRQILARAPADRMWRRRRWLILRRSRPDEVQLAIDDLSPKRAREGGVLKGRGCVGGGGGNSGEGQNESIKSFARLVSKVVGFKSPTFFRAVVAYP
ncbi:unnamed protein product [Pylaiella littoralis]